MKKILTVAAILLAFFVSAQTTRPTTQSVANLYKIVDSIILAGRVDIRNLNGLYRTADTRMNGQTDSIKKLITQLGVARDSIQLLTTQLKVTTDTSLAAYKLAADMKATYSVVAINFVDGLFGLSGNIPVANQALYDLINKAWDDKIKTLSINSTIKGY